MSATVFSNDCKDDVNNSSTDIIKSLPFRKTVLCVFCSSSSLFDILYESECMIANDLGDSPPEY